MDGWIMDKINFVHCVVTLLLSYKTSHLHVKVLLGVFYVPLNFSVYVKIKLLWHW